MTSSDGSDLMDLHGDTQGFLSHPPVQPSQAGLPGAGTGQFGTQGGFGERATAGL